MMDVGFLIRDDSSLFTALKVIRLMDGLINPYFFLMATSSANNPLSERQMDSIPLEIPSKWVSEQFFLDNALDLPETIVTSRVPPGLSEWLRTTNRRKRSTTYVAFFPGLDFSPKLGIKNREFFDHVFLNSKSDLAIAKRLSRFGRSELHYGSPSFIRPIEFKTPEAGNVVFFTQAISPKTFAGRDFILDVVMTSARLNPTREFVIKLRHLPEENHGHVHKEHYSYLDSFRLRNKPGNVHISTMSDFQAVIKPASISASVSSTAGMDSISHGVLPFFFSEFPEDYTDPLTEGIRRVLKGSGLSQNWEDFIALQPRYPDDAWLDNWFRPRQELKAELLQILN